MSNSVHTQPAADTNFVCECDKDWMRTACRGEPFYKQYDGKRYCILHYPATDKKEVFETALQRKLAAADFDFRGVWFPDEVSFRQFDFNSYVDFREAFFSGNTDFLLATFQEDAMFANAKFDQQAVFADTQFKKGANFGDAEFRGNASFRDSLFEGEGYFSTAIFSAEADFVRAQFNAGASFGNAKFHGATEHKYYSELFEGAAAISFCEAQFNGQVYFRDAEFNGDTSFDYALFPTDGLFVGAQFNSRAYFRSAQFQADAIFNKAEFKSATAFRGALFSKRVGFRGAQFSSDLNFSGVTFKATVYFQQTGFTNASRLSEVESQSNGLPGEPIQFQVRSSEVSFAGATFEEGINFEGSKFANDVTLSFAGAILEKPERAVFHTTDLRPHWFLNIDPRKFTFIDVYWGDLSRRSAIGEEETALGDIGRAHLFPLLEIAFRQLAVNAEENNRYEEAANFRYLAMDMRRRQRWRKVDLFRLHWWYWLLSGYGERVQRAFGALLSIWLLFAFVYRSGNVTWWKPTQSRDVALAAASEQRFVSQRLGLSESLVYSAGVMALQKPEPLPANKRAKTLVLLETILGPVQAALLALAIRRKFMR